jgi:hypothetical protein
MKIENWFASPAEVAAYKAKALFSQSLCGNQAASTPTYKVLQNPSTTGLGGSFRVSIDGYDYTNSIYFSWDANAVAQSIYQGLSSVSSVAVRSWGDHTKDVDGKFYEITIKVPHGVDIPPMTVDTTSVIGCGGGPCGEVECCGLAQATVTTMQDGSGNDLFYDPIPAFLFEVEAFKPQAHIEVNGITAVCATNRDFVGRSHDLYEVVVDEPNDCSFQYSPELTPMFNQVTTTKPENKVYNGDIITIRGQGFAAQPDFCMAGVSSGDSCCPKECGTCGGEDCSIRGGAERAYCVHLIEGPCRFCFS